MPLIVREKGSGTRDILESLLLANNLTLDDFASVQELGNFSALMHLVKEGLGITFAYLPVLEKGLEEGTLCPVNLQGVTLQRDFRLVTLKGSLAKEQADEFLQFIRRTEKG